MKLPLFQVSIACLIFTGCATDSTSLFAAEVRGGATSDAKSFPGEVPSLSDFGTRADTAASQLISTLGPQQTFARLGWQQNQDYQPAGHCFEFWYRTTKTSLDAAQISDCETHANDLARLYASYNTEVDPVVFKSRLYWSAKKEFYQKFLQLVQNWQAAGGSKENASFLKHPVCAVPLQRNWQGSDFFFSGHEHPLCRLYKLEALEAK